MSLSVPQQVDYYALIEVTLYQNGKTDAVTRA